MFMILCLCLVAMTCFGKKVLVVEVNKSGEAWQNLFNCYQRVTTSFVGCENGVNMATLDCYGPGYNFCRASREIGASDCGALGGTLLSHAGVLNAINALIATSETAANRGRYSGLATQKVSVSDGTKSQLYFVKAEWRYDSKDLHQGTLTITIETDDSNLLPNARQ